MKTRFFAKRTVAALLALVLAFTSMNFDYVRAYADDVEIEENIESVETDETAEYVEETPEYAEETPEDISEGEAESGEETPNMAGDSYNSLSLGNSPDCFTGSGHAHFFYSIDGGETWTQIELDDANDDRGVNFSESTVKVKVTADEGYRICNVERMFGEGQPLEPVDDLPASGDWTYEYTFENKSYLRFENIKVTRAGVGLCLNDNYANDELDTDLDNWRNNGITLQALREHRYCQFAKVALNGDVAVLEKSLEDYHVEKKIGDGKYSESNGFTIARNEKMNCFVLEATEVGTYRITVDRVDGSVEVNVVNPNIGFFTSKSFDLNNYLPEGDIYVSDAATTVYAAMNPEMYNPETDTVSWEWEIDGAGYNELTGTSYTNKGIELEDTGDGFLKVTLGADFAGHGLGIRGHIGENSSTCNLNVKRSQEGLVARTNINAGGTEDGADYSTAQFGDKHYTNSEQWLYGNGPKLAVFYNCTDKEADESKDYAPVTSGLYAKKRVVTDGTESWEEAGSDDIVLTYLGDKEELPKGMEGLWELTPKKSGEIFRICRKDENGVETYVEFTVYTARLALYDIKASGLTDFANMIGQGGYLYLNESSVSSYAIFAGNEFDSKDEWVIDSLEINGEGSGAEYDFENSTWINGYGDESYASDHIGIISRDASAIIVNLSYGEYHFIVNATSKTNGEQASIVYNVTRSGRGIVINDESIRDDEGVITGWRTNGWRKDTSIQALCETRSFRLANNDRDELDFEENAPQSIAFNFVDYSVSDYLTIQRTDDDGSSWKFCNPEYYSVWYDSEDDCFQMKFNIVGNYRIQCAIPYSDDGPIEGYVYVDVCYPENGFYTKDVSNMAEDYTSYISGDVRVKDGVAKTVYTHLCDDSYDYRTEIKESFAIKNYGSNEPTYISKDTLEGGETYKVSGCTVKLTENDNLAFEFDGSRTDFQICYKVDYDDGINSWSSDNYRNVKLDEKGLIISCDREPVRFDEYINEYYATYSKTASFEGKIDSYVAFAWNENSYVGVSYDSGEYYLNADIPVFEASRFSLEKKNELGAYASTTDMTITEENTEEGQELRLKCEVPGNYRISYAPDNELFADAYSDCNYVYVTLEEVSKKVTVYEDSEHKKALEGNTLYYGLTDRTYYLTAEDTKGGEVSLVGFTFPGVEATIKNENGWPESYYEAGDEQEGVLVSYNKDTNSIEVTLRGKDALEGDNLILVFESNHGDDWSEPFTYEFCLHMSGKGLVVKDWIDTPWDNINDAPDYEHFRFGQSEENEDDFARFRKDFGLSVADGNRYVSFQRSTEDAPDDKTLYDSVTSGLLAQVWSKEGKWADTELIELVYVGDNDKLPEDMRGLWMVKANAAGKYRILFEDGSFVLINVNIASNAFYSKNEYSTESLIMPGDIRITSDDTKEVYLKLVDPEGYRNAELLALYYGKDDQTTTYCKSNEDGAVFAWENPTLVGDDVTVEKISEDTYKLILRDGGYHLQPQVSFTDPDDKGRCEAYSGYSYEVVEIQGGLVINDAFEHGIFKDNCWKKEVDIQAIADDKLFSLAVAEDIEDRYIFSFINPAVSDISFEVETEDGNFVAVTDDRVKVKRTKIDGSSILTLTVDKIGRYRMSVKDRAGYVYINAKVPAVGFYSESLEGDAKLEEKYETYLKGVGYISYGESKQIYVNVADFEYDSEKYDLVYEMAASEEEITDADFAEFKIDKEYPEFGFNLRKPEQERKYYAYDLYGSKANFNLAFRVRLKDKTTETFSEERYEAYLRVEYSQKGLVATCEYDEEKGVFINQRNDGGEPYATYNNRLEFTEYVKTPIYFAWNTNDTFEFEKDSVSLESREEFNKETAKFKISMEDDASQEASLTWDSEKGCWVFEASGAGEYVIALDDATKTNNNKIHITIKESPLKVKVYEDKLRTILLDSEQFDSIRLPKFQTKDVTYYLSAEGERYEVYGWTEDYEAVEELLRYGEGQGRFHGYEHDGIIVNNHSDEKLDVKACAGTDINDVYLVLEIGGSDYFVYHIGFDEAETGLVATDWIESKWDDEKNAPDLSSLTFGADARFGKDFGANVSDNYKLVVFENHDESGNDYSITDSLTVKKKSDDGWVNTDDITLTFRGNEDGVPENMKGLWEVNAKNNGEYRIYYTDGSYVRLTTGIAPLALYAEQNYSIKYYMNCNTDWYVNGSIRTYVIAKDELAGRPAFVDSLILHKDGKSASYNFAFQEWENPDEIDVSDVEIAPIENGKYELFIKNGGFDIELVGHLENEDGTKEETGIYYHFEKSYKGLVINSNLALDDETGEFTGEVRNVENYVKEEWFDYRNYPCFVLANNSSDYEVSSADQLFAVSDIDNLVVEVRDGTNWDGLTGILTCDDNNVFCLETYEAGDYRITYVEPDSQYDETYVYIHISAPYIGFFDEKALNGGVFKLSEEHIYHNDSYEITRGDILMQKKTFYALRVSPKEEEGTTIDSSFNIKAKRIVDGKEVETVLVNNGSIVGNNKQISVEEVTGYPIYCDGTDDISANCKLYKITVSDLYGEDANIPFGSYFFEINNNVEAKIGDQVLYAYDDCAGLSPIGADVKKFISSWKLNHERFNNTPVEIVFEDALYKKLFYVEYAYENELDDENADKSAKTNPGKVYYRIFGNENFNPETWQEGTFEIQPALIEDVEMSTLIIRDIKTGLPDVLDIDAEDYCDYSLSKGIDYGLAGEVSANDYSFYTKDTKTPITDQSTMKAGETYLAKVLGIGKFEGAKFIDFTLAGDYLAVDSIVGTIDYVKTYTGSKIEVDPLVKVKGLTMKEGVDYKIVYYGTGSTETTPIDVGYYQYAVQGIGNLNAGSAVWGRLEIKAADLSTAKDVKLELVKESGKIAFPAKMTYDEVENYVEKGINVAVTVGGKTLVQGTDYEAGFETPVKAGTMNFVVTYKGNYSGKTTKTVAVSSEMVFTTSTVKVEVVGSDFTYIGEALTPAVNVTRISDGKPLVLGEDYTVTYASNINAGTATVTVTGLADKGYSGSVKASFAIKKVAMTAENVTVDSAATYNPAGVTPSVKVRISGEDETARYAKEGTDYVLKYENNKAAGTGKVTVTFKGNLTGSPVVKEFTVLPVNIEDESEITNNTILDYFTVDEGEYATPITELIYGNVALKEGVDYTVTYTGDPGSENAEVKDSKLKSGSKTKRNYYNVKFTFIGNYTGSFNQINALSVSCMNRTDISDFEIEGLPSTYVYNTDIVGSIQNKINNGYLYAEKDGNKIHELTVSTQEITKTGKAKVYFMVAGEAADNYYGLIVREIEVIARSTQALHMVYVAPEGAEGPYIDKKGKLQLGEISYYDGDKKLVQGKDYTLTLVYDKIENGASIETHVEFRGNYTGSVDGGIPDIRGYEIESLASVTGYKDAVYTGKEINYKLNVKVNAVTATGERFVATLKAEDYDVQYLRYGSPVESVKDAGYYGIFIAPKGKYYTTNDDGYVWYFADYESVNFNIAPAPISKTKLTLGTTKYEFNETIALEGAKPTVTVKFNNIEVPADQYTVVYTGNKKPGTGYVAVTADEANSNFTGKLTGKFDITGSVDLTTTPSVEVTVGNTAYYNPDGAIPSVTVTYAGETLVLGEDYKITAKNNKAIGTDTASLTISGTGKYKGTTQSYSYSITPADLSSPVYESLISYSKAKTYDAGYGFVDRYMLTTYNGKNQILDPGVMVGKKALKLGTDYELTYTDVYRYTGMTTENWSDSYVKNVGEYRIHITGKGNYKNTLNTDVYVIVCSPLAKNVKFKAATVNYDGQPVTNTISDVKIGSTKLVEGVDYFVSYDKEYTNDVDYYGKRLGAEVVYSYQTGEDLDNVLPGKKTAYIVGIGNYKYMGAKEVNYTIKGIDIGKAKFSKLPAYTYTGDPVFVDNDLVISTTLEGKNVTLQKGRDYVITYASETVNAGTKTVLVTGKGMFEGTSKKITFKITPKKFDGFVYPEIPEMTYDPDAKVHPELLVMNGKGDFLTEGTDYTVKLANNKAVAKSDSKKAPTMTITFKGNYSGSTKVAYTITKASITGEYYRVSAANVATTVDKKTGFVKAYKATPVVKSVDGKTTLKAGTDYTIKYTYDTDTLVYDGKTKQWVTRMGGTEVQAKDQFMAGVAIRVCVEGKNNFKGGNTALYYVVQK